MSQRLGRLIRGARTASPAPAGRGTSADPVEADARCDFCGGLVPSVHQHLVELGSGLLRCACRPCALVLDNATSTGGRYRLVPTRYRALPGLARDDALWSSLGIPVALAFLLRRTGVGPLAVFPGALGPTDAAIDPGAWTELGRRHPAAAALQDDVEALLVNRARGARDCWLVPIDACYRLVAVLRGEWRGLNGGTAVWQKLEEVFDDLRGRAAAGTAPASVEVAR